MDSIAINLHSFYTGIENIFADIASKVDGELPDGEKWHSDLLRQMATSLTEIRPAVISDKTNESLRDLLAFRHVILNIYSLDLDEKNVLILGEKLSSFSHTLFEELNAFVEFLKKSGENS